MKKFYPNYRLTASALALGCLLGVAPASAQTDPAAIAAAKEATAKAATPPASWPGPTAAPAPSEGKKVTIISCAQASNCSVDANAALEAAQALGWNATVVDGKGDPGIYNASIRAAVNGGSDGIINISLPTALVQDGLRYAAQRKVPVINAADIISEDPLVFGSVEHQWKDQGIMLGNWIISDSGGKAGVVVLRDEEFPGIKIRQDNVIETLKACTDCKVLEEVNLTITQATNPAAMSQQVQSLIARFGDELQYVVTPFGTVDGLVTPVLKSRGRSDVKVVGYDGNKQQVQLCKQGSVGAIAVTMLAWTGWGAVDQMNRAFAGEKAAPQNVPAFLAAGDGCTGDGFAEDASTFDYKAEYLKLWGKAQ